MSRSGYDDEYGGSAWELIMYRGAVTSAIRGKRGQAFLTEAVAALDALPNQELIANDLEDQAGNVCFLGAVGKARGMDMATLDPENIERVADAFGIAASMAREIVWANDEQFWRRMTLAERFAAMREWAVKHIRTDKA